MKKWTIPWLLFATALIESVIYEYRQQYWAAIQAALLTIAFAILIHKFTP